MVPSAIPMTLWTRSLLTHCCCPYCCLCCHCRLRRSSCPPCPRRNWSADGPCSMTNGLLPPCHHPCHCSSPACHCHHHPRPHHQQDQWFCCPCCPCCSRRNHWGCIPPHPHHWQYQWLRHCLCRHHCLWSWWGCTPPCPHHRQDQWLCPPHCHCHHCQSRWGCTPPCPHHQQYRWLCCCCCPYCCPPTNSQGSPSISWGGGGGKSYVLQSLFNLLWAHQSEGEVALVIADMMKRIPTLKGGGGLQSLIAWGKLEVPAYLLGCCANENDYLKKHFNKFASKSTIASIVHKGARRGNVLHL